MDQRSIQTNMADESSQTSPEIQEKEKEEEQFGDPPTQPPVEEEEFGDIEASKTNKTLKLKRKNVPEVFVLQPDKQKIQEKRMKIEISEPKIPHLKLQEAPKMDQKMEKIVTSKPPLPPPKKVPVKEAIQSKLKRKFEDDTSHQIQKLAANNEQLRLEITELKILLQNEKIVSRRLR